MVPQAVQNLGAWLIFFGVLFGGSWLPPVRRVAKWLFRRNVSEPLGAWFKEHVAEELQPTAHLVAFHLGPNGTTKPVHERIRELEAFALQRLQDPEEQ